MRGRKKGATNIDYSRVESLYDPNINDMANAKKIGVSRSTITHWRSSKGYKPCENKHVKINKDEFYRLYNLGWSDVRIAKEFGTQTYNISNYRMKHGIPSNHPWLGRSATEFIDSTLESIDSRLVLTDDDKPWKDPESLYCDKDFLERFKVGNFEV